MKNTTLQIYNSLSNQKEKFKSINNNKVKIYVCGLTIYDLVHLGHAKLYIVFDIIVRYLKFIGYDVTYVRNITDIDDKIINKASEKNISVSELTNTFIKEMHQDFEKLGLVNPDIEPKATDHLEQIIIIIQKLLDNNSAYVAKSGDIYFSVYSFEKYGILSGRDLKGQEAGKRVDVVVDKKDPEDFVLWKMAKEGEPCWSSPWGEGRPGWHIECSAMSMHYLGEYFDIHGGGYDLLFPHHENELAQSCAVTGHDFVKYWIHIGYLQLNEEKMSKSTGNFFTVRDLLKKYHPETIRICLANSHYRSQQNFSYELIQEADTSLIRLYNAISGLALKKIDPKNNTEYKAKFIECMNDDFNTSKALSVLFELSHKIEKNKNKDIQEACKCASTLKQLANVIGILNEAPIDFLQFGFSEDKKNMIQDLISKRSTAREQKNWELADSFREQLNDFNIDIEDGVGQTTWQRRVF